MAAAGRGVGGLFEVLMSDGGLPRLGLLVTSVFRAHRSLLPAAVRPILSVGARPVSSQGAIMLGASLVLLAVGTHHLTAQLLPTPSQRSSARRLCAWLVCAGSLLVAIQPVLDPTLLVESVLWTLFHPTASLTFGGTPRLLLWPPWLLYLISLALLSAIFRLLPLALLSPSLQLAGCALLGLSTALTAAGSLLPLERSLYLLLAAASAAGGAFLGQCLWPHVLVRSPRAPALLLAIFYALAPIGLLAISHAFQHSATARTVGAETLYRAAWHALYAGVSAIGALLTRLHAGQANQEDPLATGSSHPQPRGAGARFGGGGGDGAGAASVLSSMALRAEAYESGVVRWFDGRSSQGSHRGLLHWPP